MQTFERNVCFFVRIAKKRTHLIDGCLRLRGKEERRRGREEGRARRQDGEGKGWGGERRCA